jgi:multidrug resistance efflux pump
MNTSIASPLTKLERLNGNSAAAAGRVRAAEVKLPSTPDPMLPEIRKAPAQWKRVMMTLGTVAVAIGLTWELWWHYMRAPWTRDGRVRAESVDVAADISGRVTALNVIDNQFVHKGDALFIVDPDYYRYALNQADAAVQNSKVDLDNKRELAQRRKRLDSGAVISKEELQTYLNSAAQAAASYQQALATRDVAQLNMNRTTVYAPVNGYITNLHLRVGDYAMPGATKLTILDSDSFWVAGYFEETKLPRVKLGYSVRIKLMGVGPEIEGHVESISSGIADTNAGGTGVGLANVDPIFTWVRLAQRIPVRIHMDRIPPDVKVVAGQTCTVVVTSSKKPQSELTSKHNPEVVDVIVKRVPNDGSVTAQNEPNL